MSNEPEAAGHPGPDLLSDWLRDQDIFVLAALARAARASGTSLLDAVLGER